MENKTMVETKEKKVQFKPEQLAGFIENQDNPASYKNKILKEIEDEREQVRSKLVEIFVELFDEEILERRTKGTIYDYLKEALKDKKCLDMEINSDPYKSYWDPVSFRLNSIANNKCYKSYLGIYEKQIRYTDVNLRKLYNQFDKYSNEDDFNNLTKDIIADSKQFEPYLEGIRSKGFTVEIDYNYCYYRSSFPTVVVFIR